MPEEVVRPTPISPEQVRDLFQLWNQALATGDPQKVADRYSADAVLLPTLSDSARYTNDRIADYFVGFLKKKPVGEILEGNIKIGANWAQDAGKYANRMRNLARWIFCCGSRSISSNTKMSCHPTKQRAQVFMSLPLKTNPR